ncbi:MAG: hypothetical protein QOC63_3046 [Mycobacterium sp.]|jgi:hypothetical protein|nr:hypothetical protein [Mycobacterium sp.]
MRFAFKTTPQNTTWADMLAVWREADDIDGYESGWTFDHFYPIFTDSTGPCLEGWTTLTALAQATTRLRLGTMVTASRYDFITQTCDMLGVRCVDSVPVETICAPVRRDRMATGPVSAAWGYRSVDAPATKTAHLPVVCHARHRSARRSGHRGRRRGTSRYVGRTLLADRHRHHAAGRNALPTVAGPRTGGRQRILIGGGRVQTQTRIGSASTAVGKSTSLTAATAAVMSKR